jgi:hypothetical protein
MLNILQGSRKNADVLQMIYLNFMCNTSAFFIDPCKTFNMLMTYADLLEDYRNAKSIYYEDCVKSADHYCD